MYLKKVLNYIYRCTLVCDIIFVFVYFSELLVKLVYLSVTQLMPSLVNIYQQCKYIFYIMCEEGKWAFGLYIHVPEPTSVKCMHRTIQYKDFNQESCDLAYSSTYGHKTFERRVYTRRAPDNFQVQRVITPYF